MNFVEQFYINVVKNGTYLDETVLQGGIRTLLDVENTEKQNIHGVGESRTLLNNKVSCRNYLTGGINESYKDKTGQRYEVLQKISYFVAGP